MFNFFGIVFVVISTTEVNLLAQAKQLCRQRNVRLTPQRLAVLRLMLQQSSAISAYDLLDLLRLVEPQAKPPTVYRALYFLIDQGFIHRIESTNSYILCYHFGWILHSSALFICNRCNQVTEQAMGDVEKILKKLAKDAGFVIRHSVVEAHGLCASCAEVESCASKHNCHEHDHSIAIKGHKLTNSRSI